MAENQLVVTEMESADLEYLAGMAKEVNVTNLRVPILKINYDAKSKAAKPGEWVVGQKKDNTGKIITDEGKKVTHFIILKVRNKFSLYNQKDLKQNCDSPIFKDFEVVKGGHWNNKCGKDCPYRSKEATPNCSFQKVVFSVAITEDGEKIDCISYFHGKSFMPFIEYYTALPEVSLPNGKKINLPYFSIINKLDSIADSNGGISFWIAKFTKSEVISSKEAVDKLKLKADKIEELIAGLNGISVGSTTSESESTPTDLSSTAPSTDSPSTDVLNAEVVEEKDVNKHVANLFND